MTPAGSFWLVWGLGFAAMLAVGAATAALDVLFGVVGVAVAATVLVFLTGPLFSVRDPRLLPSPWWQAEPWTPHGATLHLATSLSWFGSSDVLRPALLLGGLLVLSLLVLAVAPLRDARSGQERRAGSGHWRLLALAVAVPTALAVSAAVVLAPAGAGRGLQGSGARSVADRLRACSHDEDQGREGASTTTSGPCAPARRSRAPTSAPTCGCRTGDGSGSSATPCARPTSTGEVRPQLDAGPRPASASESVLPADRGALIPDRARRRRLLADVDRPRPAHGYDLVGVATQRVRATSAPDGIFAFETLGPSMAVFVVQRGKTPQLLAHRDIGPDRSTPPGRCGGPPPRGRRLGLPLRHLAARRRRASSATRCTWPARVPTTCCAATSGSTGTDAPGRARAPKAKELIRSDGGVSQTLSVFHRGNRWYAVSKRNEVLGTNLVVWTAPSPTGPWDSGTTVAALPSDPTTGELRYMPLAHPDLIKDPRR